jgi:hypothetical protein
MGVVSLRSLTAEFPCARRHRRHPISEVETEAAQDHLPAAKRLGVLTPGRTVKVIVFGRLQFAHFGFFNGLRTADQR